MGTGEGVIGSGGTADAPYGAAYSDLLTTFLEDGRSKIEDWSAANVVTNPLRFATEMLGQGTRNLAGERKHAFTAGTGTADAETNLREVINAWRGAPLDLVSGALEMPESTVRSIFLGQQMDEQPLYFDTKKILGVDDPWTGTRIGGAGRVIRSFFLGDAFFGRALAGVPAYQNLAKIKKVGPFKNGGRLAQAMIREGVVMKSSVYRHDGTIFNSMQEGLNSINPGWGEAMNWIAVGEYDHPAVKEMKGMLEATGFPLVFSSIFAVARGGKNFVTKKYYQATRKRLPPAPGTFGRPDEAELGRIIDDQIRQTDEAAKGQLDSQAAEQLELPLDGVPPKSKIRGDKNQPITEAWQRAHTSTNTPGKILRQLDDLDDLPEGIGSTDSPLSGWDAERFASDPAAMTEWMKQKAIELLGEPYYQGLMKDIGGGTQDFNVVFGSSLRRFQEMVGRDVGGMTTEQFWQPFMRQFEKVRGRGGSTAEYQTWAIENIVVNDLVNGALFKDLRTRAKAAREVADISDILSVDSPFKGIADRLVFGLTNAKKARYLISEELAALAPGQRAQAIAERTAALHDETTDGVRLMMQFLRESDSNELAQGILEVFSMSSKIKNFKDFDAWMRQKVRGGDFAGHNKEGLLMKELGGVMVNSILSGAKTPLRAIMGTTANAYLNEVTTLLGTSIRGITGSGDAALLHASAASSKAMFELIPDAFKVFRANLDSYFSGDIATIKSRYSQYTKNDENWDLLAEWTERNGTEADKAAFYAANVSRRLNDSKFLTWSSRVMGATDDTFRWLLSKARARKKAMLNVMRENPDIEITPAMLKKAEDAEFAALHDLDGNIDITKDAFLHKNYREVTLTTELKGFSKGLETLMKRYPLTKPFFLFARTGINGLRLSVKNLPIVGAVVDESREILLASAKNLDEGDLLKYGIETMDDLQSAKSMVLGRQALGSAVVSVAAHKYMSGGLTGNGPADVTTNRAWRDAGWTPRSIKMGNTWVSYDSFEPFNLVLANIADIGDNLELMGPQFSEKRLQLVVAALGKGASSKTYLQGIGQLFDLLSGDAGYASGRILGNLVNNQMPLAGLRNDIANVISPQMRELNADFLTHIANRNPIFKGMLSIKYDMINGKPIRPWHFPDNALKSAVVSVAGAASPIQLRADRSPGRKLIWNSNYDLRIAAFSAPDGTNLKDHPNIRSKFQEAIGKTGLEEELNLLAGQLRIKYSLAAMRLDKKAGKWDLDPMKSYMHNRLLKQLFDRKVKQAWASIQHLPEIQDVIALQRSRSIHSKNRLYETQNLMEFPK